MTLVVSGLAQVTAEFDVAAKTTVAQAKQVVSKGCLNIKNDWQQAWSGLRGEHKLARSISYDVIVTADAITGVVGPDKSRAQGPLGNIIEFGTSRNAPIPGGRPALEREAPRFVEAMSQIGPR